MKNTTFTLGLFFFLILSLSACQSAFNKAARETKYSAYELIGVEKRDLLKKYVKNTKESQEETQEAFEDALTQLKKTYSYDGGKIEAQYKSLNGSYEEAKTRAAQVHQDIEKVQTVANDLFTEWQKEIGEMSSTSLKTKSKEQLLTTQKRFGQLRDALKKSESKIQPILTKLKDHTLYMKHNLNAKAIASLKDESVRIETEISSLVESMKTSIRESEAFIKEIE